MFASGQSRKEGGFSAALFITPPKLSLLSDVQDQVETQPGLSGELSLHAIDQVSTYKGILCSNVRHTVTVSTDDIGNEVPNQTAPHCLSEELMKLIDSGGSTSPRPAPEQRTEVREFDFESKFESGFQRRLSQLERNRKEDQDQEIDEFVFDRAFFMPKQGEAQ
jgi:hypothetical protein